MTNEVSRRTLLQAGALGAGAAVTSAALGVVPALRGKRAIVIGSGFGGTVAAYRLGRAGLRVTVLEREERGEGAPTPLEQPRRREWTQVFSSRLPYDVMDQTYWPRARANLNAITATGADMAHRAWREHVIEFGQTPVAIPFAPHGIGAVDMGNVTVHTGHEVTEVHALSGSDGFEVKTKQLETFSCDYLFMAAGTIGTNSLLVTARAKGWLPRLRSTVGKGFGTNGAFLVKRLRLRNGVGRAPGAPGGVKFYDDNNPHVSAAAMTLNATTTHLITSMTAERGEIRYASGTAQVHWPYGVLESKAEKAGVDLTRRLWWETEGRHGRLLNGLPAYDRETGFGSALTAHALGGMAMGVNTDFDGKSLDYDNLYCVDGSLLPGTACLAEPALTITANAERIMDLFLAAHA